MTRPIKKINIPSDVFTNIDDRKELEILIKKQNGTKLELIPGETESFVALNKFLNEKVNDYFKNISFPEKSRYHTSRLSPYIAYGNISIRQIWQECQRTKPNIQNKMSINQYMARLKWHCHFIQKFETDPRLEFKNMNPAFDNIREKKNKHYINAWKRVGQVIPWSMRDEMCGGNGLLKF